MIALSANDIDHLTDYGELVEALRNGFSNDNIKVPQRHHHDYPNPGKSDSTLLLMPAWQKGEYLGVKLVTVSPENGNLGLPAIQGVYNLFDAKTGKLLAQLDGKSLTAKRTAATSALASSFLSRPDSTTMLMIGTGALSIPLIEAHATVRPIQKVLIWGRSKEKAESIGKSLNANFEYEIVNQIEDGVSASDIVSVATLSPNPLVFGKDAIAGQHYDLVGAYKPNMREADDVLIQKAKLFIDTRQGMHESGDIHIPLTQGTISESDIGADLYQMTQTNIGRKSTNDITVFKSVGYALEDLVAAIYYYKKAIHAT